MLCVTGMSRYLNSMFRINHEPATKSRGSQRNRGFQPQVPLCKSKGFSFIEILIVLVVLGTLSYFAVGGFRSFYSAVQFDMSLDQVVVDIKFTQALADTSHRPCSIVFAQGANEYSVTKDGVVIKTSYVAPQIKFEGKSYFAFVDEGETDFSGSGTIVMKSTTRTATVVLSKDGRLRVE
jgi:prepilin-type N-terminal cleavage/methylation domain-containing protein